MRMRCAAGAGAFPAAHTSPPAIRIDKGVPMNRRGRLSAVRIAMESLEVGDSFVYPTVHNNLKLTGIYAGRTANYITDKQFTRRTVEENGKRVVRVWRVR